MKATILTPEEKQARKQARKDEREKLKELDKQAAERNQEPIRELTISIEWKKSRTWGSNPSATAEVYFLNNSGGPWKTGFFRSDKNYTCSGCGYDKESTVIAQIFNDFLKYKLWAMSEEQIKGGHGTGDKGSAPYGIHRSNYNNMDYRGFSGGIGTSCYYSIAEYIGGKFEHIASGKTFDVFKYTDIKAI